MASQKTYQNKCFMHHMSVYKTNIPTNRFIETQAVCKHDYLMLILALAIVS